MCTERAVISPSSASAQPSIAHWKRLTTLQREHNISAEVIDARFLNPLNYQPIIESVRKTGKVLLASDATERGSFLHTMASNITQLAFDYLDGPVVVLGSRNWITPPAELDDSFFPSSRLDARYHPPTLAAFTRLSAAHRAERGRNRQA